MKKIFIITICLFCVENLFSQNSLLKFGEYKPAYVSMSQSQLEAKAKAMAMKEAEQKANFNYYKNLSINSGIKNDYTDCVYYAKAAYKYGYVDSQLLYYEGKSYFMLGKIGKYKRVIRKANKYKYLSVVRSLKILKL